MTWDKSYYYQNREHIRTQRKTHYDANPEKILAWNNRSRLKRKYGITPEDLDAMWQQQKGLCGICGNPLRRGQGGYAVDHDHETRRVRGLLCVPCNKGLFLVEKGLVPKAEKYLSLG